MSGEAPRRHAGLLGAGAMLAAAFTLAAAAVLLWIIAGLAGGALPRRFGPGDALAGLVYLIAFLPNIVTSAVALSLGAPVEAGARVTFGGRAVGPLESYSLADWGGADRPAYAVALLLIPLVACLLGGLVAYRASKDRRATVTVVAIAAGVFAIALFLLAILSDARLGAGLVHRRGFGVVAPQPVAVFFLALFWGSALGLVGWTLGERRAPPNQARDNVED